MGRDLEARAVDGVVTVAVPETPASGYRWVVRDQPGVEVLDSRFTTSPVAPERAGDAGVRTFVVRVAAGGSPFHLDLRREWEQGAAESVQVTVSD